MACTYALFALFWLHPAARRRDAKGRGESGGFEAIEAVRTVTE